MSKQDHRALEVENRKLKAALLRYRLDYPVRPEGPDWTHRDSISMFRSDAILLFVLAVAPLALLAIVAYGILAGDYYYDRGALSAGLFLGFTFPTCCWFFSYVAGFAKKQWEKKVQAEEQALVADLKESE